MDDERKANGQEIERKIKEGQPFDRIFPARTIIAPPPVPFADGAMEFVSALRPSPHGGTPTRYFRLECQHAIQELYLLDETDGSPGQVERWSGEVLGRMIETIKTRAAEGGLLCLCWPRGWRAA